MSTQNKFNPLKNFRHDIPASIVVFLVAVPLCLGIALASGAPLFSGLIAGMLGGIVVGSLSKSALGVSGPAAGLAVIVFTAIQDLGSFEIFLVAVVLAGLLQIILGFAKGGIIAYYFPNSVILGMLAGIGVFIFLKQIPLALGVSSKALDKLSFEALMDGELFNALGEVFVNISPGAVIITLAALLILLVWESKWVKNIAALSIVPGPLVAVIAGIIMDILFSGNATLGLRSDQLVQIPVSADMSEFFGNFRFPNWSALSNPEIYITAVVIAVIASLETLLSVEATDKLDPYKRVTPANRELKAQGVANILSGLIGGIPVTQVIVRSSANVQSGGRTKASAIMHGFLILISIIAITVLLNKIPLATLAAILMLVGYKLAKPSLFKQMWSKGSRQFAPFVVTVVGIVFTDLLMGLGMGLALAAFFVLRNNYKFSYQTLKSRQKEGRHHYTIKLAHELTFLNKATIIKTLSDIPDNSVVELDASTTIYVDADVEEVIENFKTNAKERGIELTLIGFYQDRLKDLPEHISIMEKKNSNEEVSKEVINPHGKD